MITAGLGRKSKRPRCELSHELTKIKGYLLSLRVPFHALKYPIAFLDRILDESAENSEVAARTEFA